MSELSGACINKTVAGGFVLRSPDDFSVHLAEIVASRVLNFVAEMGRMWGIHIKSYSQYLLNVENTGNSETTKDVTLWVGEPL